MTPADLTTTRERLGLGRKAFAEALGIHRDSLRAYEAGDREIPRTVALACAALLYGLPPVGGEIGKD